MKKWILMGVFMSPVALAAVPADNCSTVECHAGDQALTSSTKDDPYYACPTMELSDYVNGTFGMVAIAHQLSGRIPNISPKTGEPEFEGQTKEMVDAWRESAGVKTFDQAFNQCQKGKNKLSVVILNVSDSGLSAWVSDQKKNMFWLPKGYIEKR